jgi:electron transfer flavoprotein alpha/beta subunit
MRIWVQVWCEVDPTLNVRIDRTTGQPVVEPADRLCRVSRLGRSGVAAALALGPAEVTAFALGPGHTDALRHALAAGASRSLEVLVDGGETVSPVVLAEWLRQERPDLVIADRWAGWAAGRLGWAHLAGLEEPRLAGGVLRATRRLERGAREVVSAQLPALVRLHEESASPPYIAQARLATVAQAPIDRVTLPAAGGVAAEAGSLQLARPRTRLGATPVPAASSGSSRLQALIGGGSPAVATKAASAKTATPEELADEFVRYLKHHQLLPERGRHASSQ